MKYRTIRMSSDGYGNAQGHYLHRFDDFQIIRLMDDAKEYVEQRSSYTLRDIQFELFRNQLDDKAVPSLIIDWSRIPQQYPKITLGDLLLFSYDQEALKDKYPLLTIKKLPYWDSNNHTFRDAITLEGRY